MITANIGKISVMNGKLYNIYSYNLKKKLNIMSYKIQEGDVVTVHYVGTLDDGNEFDNSYQTQNPLTFKVGENKLIPGFENAVLNREKGEEVNVKIPKEDAYGPYSEKNIHDIPKNQINLPEGAEAGQSIEGTAPTGERFICKILEIKENSVSLDLNSPLAGKDLSFKIEILDVKGNNQDTKEESTEEK